jgi:hypothetical protein
MEATQQNMLTSVLQRMELTGDRAFNSTGYRRRRYALTPTDAPDRR